MRLFPFRCLPLLAVAMLIGSALFAQKNQNYRLYLRNGIIEPPSNLLEGSAGPMLRKNSVSGIKRLVILQFYDIPQQQSVERLRNAGMELLDYIPDNAYTATVSGEPDIAVLRSVNARSILELTPAQKIHPALKGPAFPEHAVKVPGKVDVCISYPRSADLKEVKADLQRNNIETISESLAAYQMLEVRVEQNRLEELAALPWLQYIEAVRAPDELLNDKSEAVSKANVLASGLPGGRKLDGEGVVIGIGDVGNLYDHGDLTGRILSFPRQGSYWHGLHIAGTAAGAGIVNEKYKGYAPKANIVMQGNAVIWEQASMFVRDFGMVVTNNAYASPWGGSGCMGFGWYSYYSGILDRQAGELPHLLHVFAAGNSGASGPCNGLPAPAGFGNVHGDLASAKNIISVGRTASTGEVSSASSKGPVMDGRIKPDLIAPGGVIFSTIEHDAYQSGSGTSMATPAVTGGTALLYQRYKQLHSEQNPKSALVKALLCNGASDRGLAGPDFSHGFGMMNLLRSVTMLEKGHYFNGSLAHDGTNEFQVNVPAGTAVIKVMLYWHDRPASALAGNKTLVNNLDLQAVRPNGSRQLPLVPNPATPEKAAVAGVDTTNNAEQIVIENPEAGSYTLKVTGTQIPSGPQDYYLVYDIIEKSAVLTYPIGSERLTKGDVVYISWDSYGNPASTFAISYSLNNGASWSTINAAVPASATQLSWTVPDAFTTTAKIRLVQNETGIVKESGAFSIMALPVVSLASVQCEGYTALQWTAVNGASDYEVMRLQGAEMKSVGVTTALKYTFDALSRDTTYYFSVRPRLDGIPGRRGIAVKRKPDSGTCAGNISDNNVGIDSIISPAKSGRMLTSSQISGTQPVTIGIRNFDDQPLTRPFEVGYSIGQSGASVHWETITSGISANGYLEYTFNKTVDLQAAGTYVVNFFAKLDGDLVQVNNQRTVVVNHVTNPLLTLPYSEDFESLPPRTFRSETFGMGYASRYDFTSQDNIGRLRTDFGPEMAYSGEKALTLDADNWNYNEYSTSFTGTYNLAGHDAQGEEIRLTFRFRRLSDFYIHGGDVGVYVRGKDTDPWIFAFDYNEESYLPSDKGFKLATVAVSQLLNKNSQNYSTSFQVMWRQKTSYAAPTDGYAVDDIRLFATRSDVELARIIKSPESVCNGGYAAITVDVKNNGAEDFYNLPLRLAVDGNEVYEGIIPVVRAGKDTLYTFSFFSDLYVEGDHVIKALVLNGLDIAPGNDSMQITVNTPPSISVIPYLEDFENGPGGWQTLDPNSSWQFGKPGGTKIKSAASGAHAWKTNLAGTYQNDDVSYLYSPCLNLSGVYSATMSFSFSVDPDACGETNCEIADIEYSYAGGWYSLNSVNWGNPQDRSRWRVGSVGVPTHATRLRFVVKGSPKVTEGIAIDNIHIHETGPSIFNYPLLADEVARQNVQGYYWLNFRVNDQMVASIQPNGQDLGEISARTYIDYDEIKHINGQYYPGRTYKFTASQQSFSKPVGVRLYFSDSELKRLIEAPDKAGVSKPASAYELAVSQYSGINEDGDLTNNASKVWSYYPNPALKIAPYVNGYYIEFQTKTFSEFWLAGGYIGVGDPLPVTLSAFSAKLQRNAENRQSVLLEWQTTREEAFSHFEIEVARDRESLLKKVFSKIGEVSGKGGSAPSARYSFTDNSPSVEGTSYYRLKMVDRATDHADGSFEYSSIRSVNFDGEKQWKVFPNPADKRIFVEFEEKAGKLLKFSISDIDGRVVFTGDAVTDGSMQKKEIDLSSSAVTPGIYLLKVVSEDRERVFKIISK